MADRGRPRIFVTNAEKQKAYRDRKRQDSALRNLPFEQLSQIVTEQNELEVLWGKAHEISDERRQVIANFYQLTVIEDKFDEWNRRVRELADQWWAAHQIWASKWRESGCPPGSWTKADRSK